MFSKEFGRKISVSKDLREESDYTMLFVEDREEALEIINVADKLYLETKNYVVNKIKQLSNCFKLGEKENVLDFVIDSKKDYTIKDILKYTKEGKAILENKNSIYDVTIKELNEILENRNYKIVTFEGKNNSIYIDDNVLLEDIQNKNLSLYNQKQNGEEM